MKKLIAFFFVCLFSISLNAQKLTEKDAIILNEINEINISSKKYHFIHFYFKKAQTVVLNSKKGVEEFSEIVLPENHDPTYHYHAPEIRNYQFLLSNLNIYDFDIHKIKNGDTLLLEVETKDSLVEMVNAKHEFGKNLLRKKYPKNIAIGDTLLITYNYRAQYADNFSILGCYRVFFNSHIPKKNYTLMVRHHKNLRTEFSCKNITGKEKTDTLEDVVCHTWVAKNLDGCLKEEGAIPYKTLPNVLITAKPVELIYTIPSTWQQSYRPFYIYPVYSREGGHFVILESIKDGVITKQYSLMYKFVEKHTSNITDDSTGYKTLLSLHNKIVDDFAYQNDYSHFAKQVNPRKERIGDFLTSETFRDLSRYDTYVAILLKSGLGYLTAYPVDKRVGEISDEYFRPMYDNDFFIAAVLKNNIIQYILPKRHKFGYYTNEMPFYYENSNVRLISIFDYIVYKDAYNDAFRYANIPNSSLSDNLRTTNTMVNVSLENNTLAFMTKVSLAGQFSTMTRGLYTHNYKDPTVNNRYNQKVWEINENIKPTKVDAKVLKKVFPFNASINATYSSNELLEKDGKNYKLNLNKWFNYIIYENIDYENRNLDFYTDFLGRDTYNYMLQFDKEVKLTNPMQKIHIKNDFAELIIEIVQMGNKQIRISSVYSVIKGKVGAEKINDVKEVFDKIIELNNYTLMIEPV